MQVVLIGATRGIGAGLAAAYRASGHDVLGTGRNGTADIDLDVTREGDFDALKARVGDAPVDLLICNAGVYLDRGASLDTGYDAALWAESFAVNVAGVFFSVRAVLNNLVAAGGKVAVISSQMGSDTRAPGKSYAYRASKAAALNLGRNLATDLAPRGVAVGIYHPGWVRTDMGGQAADIDVDEAVDGLVARFSELDLASTGCFRTWDGRDHPY